MRGSLLVPETGDYEICDRTEHAAVLFLNDDRVPLIDALIKSGDITEFRANAFLLLVGRIIFEWNTTKARRASVIPI